MQGQHVAAADFHDPLMAECRQNETVDHPLIVVKSAAFVPQ
jgi:hypothetical protein